MTIVFLNATLKRPKYNILCEKSKAIFLRESLCELNHQSLNVVVTIVF